MKINDILDDGLCQEIDRICGSTVGTYPFKAKASRLNFALDRYFALASHVERRWPADDTNQTTPPIDTQDIVSGTNRYKFSAFTDEILSTIKFEILDSSSRGYNLIPETMDILNRSRFGNFQELYLATNRITGIPTHYMKYGDFIYLRPTPDYSLAAALKAFFDRPASKFNFFLFTVTIATPGVFTATAHGLVANDTVIFNTDGALPTGLSVDTTYYVISAGLTANAFEVATTLGGSAINTTGTQSGNHSFLKTNKEPGIPSVHHVYLARNASLPFLIEKEKFNVAESIRKLIGSPDPSNPYFGGDEKEIVEYFSNRDKDNNQNQFIGIRRNSR